MADGVTPELIYEVLESVQRDISDLKAGQQRTEADVRSLTSHMGDFLGSEARQDGEFAEIRARAD